MAVHRQTGSRSPHHGTWITLVVVLLFSVIGAGLAAVSPPAAAVNYPPIPPSDGPELSSCLHPANTATIPKAQMNSAIAGIEAMVGSHLQGIGPCASGHVVLTLTPGSERLAKRIRSVYGPAVLITIGLTVWNGHAGRSPHCGSLPSWTRPPNGLAFSLHLPSRQIRVGGTLTGTLVASNRGTTPFRMDPLRQPLASRCEGEDDVA